VQLVFGDGKMGAALVAHSGIDGVCFTGSMAAAKEISRSLATTGRGAVPFIAETGGINAMIVDSSALPEQVVRDVLTSAFQSAGQRCSALRILCLQDEIADRVIALLQGALAELRVGDPQNCATDLGPLIDAEAQRNVTAYLESHKILASAPVPSSASRCGFFVAPSLIEIAKITDVQREIFGPVLHVVRFPVQQMQTIVDEINQLGYGLTLGIHTRIRARVRDVVEAADVGNIYVNRNQVGAVVGQQPFGGHRLSGTGPKAGGPHYLLRLSQPIGPAATTETQSTSDMSITAAPLNSKLVSNVAQLRIAQRRWASTPQRSEKIQFACSLLSANSFHPMCAMAQKIRLPDSNKLHVELPAIAGEENRLHLRPRGLLLSLSASVDIDTAALQLIKSVAAGNGVIAHVRTEDRQRMHDLIAELAQAGMPQNLVECVCTDNNSIPSAWLTELPIDGVIFDGSTPNRNRIAVLLANRTGPILPIIASADAIYRYCLEQTVTINTAAAGGDPRLLGIETHFNPLREN
jgi:RHH-type proline utilization regulon transcriptional repressor/proline dehydrogenase/delta 1-pyrroline-5-carboxylate dehydrogenase